MTNLRKLGCWTVIPRSSLPPNTPIVGTRWTYRKKTDENGTFTRYRGRLVAKGFSQILGVNYFESFSPDAVRHHPYVVRVDASRAELCEALLWQSRASLCRCSRSINTTFKLPSSKVLSILLIRRSIVNPPKVMKIDVTMSINFISTSTV